MKQRLLTLWAILLALVVTAPPLAAQVPYYSKGQSDLRYASTLVPQSGLMADYQMRETSGTTLADGSGNGRAAAFNGSTNPTWVGAPTGGLAFSGSQYVPLPASLNSALTIMAVVENDPLSTWLSRNNAGTTGSSNPTLLNPTTGSGKPCLILAPLGSQGGLSPGVYSSAATYTNEFASGPTVCAWTLGASAGADRVWLEDRKVESYVANGGNAGRMTSDGWCLGGGTAYTNCYMNGRVYRLLFWNRVLSDAEIRQARWAVRLDLARRGVLANYDPDAGTDSRLVGFGDSLMYGQGVATPYLHSSNVYDLTYTTYNLGVSGSRASSWRGFFERDGLRYLSAGAERNAVVIGLGTNDGNSATAAASLVAAISKAQLTWPRNTSVLLVTLTSRTSADSTKATQNPILRRAAAERGWILVDAGSVPQLGADGASASSTYFQDGLHYKQAGADLIRTLLVDSVNYAPYAGLNVPSYVSSTSYTMLPRDALSVFQGGANGAWTLPPATGHNWAFRIHNPTAFTLTLAPVAANSETINGASSLVVAAGQTVTIRPRFRGETNAGCDWTSQ